LNTKSKTAKIKETNLHGNRFEKKIGNKISKEIDRINGFEALGSQFSLISC
jgi:hypothetical protein